MRRGPSKRILATDVPLNLVLHVLTAPVFMAGTGAILLAPALGWALAAAGAGAMAAAMESRGRPGSVLQRGGRNGPVVRRELGDVPEVPGRRPARPAVVAFP